MDATSRFVEMFVGTDYNDIPHEAIESAKREVLDTLGVAVAGSSQPGITELYQVIKEWGGAKQSTVIAYGSKVPAPNAAQVNAAMAHALDYDDDHGAAVVHTGVIVVPSCFAMSERIGNVNGKRYITAIALGSDLLARLGLATRPGTSLLEAGWHFTSLYGFLGAAAVSGKLLNLDQDRLTNALGIAYHQCAGNTQCVIDGALTKRMGPGFAVRGGITAALMAERGITGARDCLEGVVGLYNLYHWGNYSPSILMADLGKKFEGTNITIKPYPCCTSTHAFIDAALELVNEHDIKPEDVQEITVIAGSGSYALCVPLETKSNPRNAVDTQFSVPWAVATAIARRRVSMEDFTEAAVGSDDILKISSRIRTELDTSLTRSGNEPGLVKIVSKEAKAYAKRVDNARGSPENAFTFDQCVRKFRDCVACSARTIPSANIEEVIELIARIEKVDDVSRIIGLLCS